jgi:integrase
MTKATKEAPKKKMLISPAEQASDLRQRCDAAGLPKRCTLRGFRKGRARNIAEAGGSAHKIQAITGHKTLSEVQHYTEAADRKRLGESATRKLRESGA